MAYRQGDSQRRNDTVRFDLMERIGVLSIKDTGWTREVNIVSWNNGAAKVDIREWDPDHKRMTRGVTLFEEEAETLTKLLARRYGLRLEESRPAHRIFAGADSDENSFRENRPPGPGFDTAGAGASAGEAAEAAAVQDFAAGSAPAAEAAAPDPGTAAAAPAEEEAFVAESSLY